MRAILTFHSIDNKNSVISYSPVTFENLLATLARKNIPIYDLDKLIKPETTHGVALTFDDGMQSVYKNALPILKEHHACAHLYATTSAVGNDLPWPRDEVQGTTYKMLGWDELEKLYQENIYIENHTHTHPDFRELSSEQMTAECEQADEIIEQHLGRRPQHFAYPFGFHNTLTRDFTRQRYTTSVTTELKPLSKTMDHAAVPRLDTYYLQSDWSVEHIDSVLEKAYLATRNMLRNIKGSQNRANCD